MCSLCGASMSNPFCPGCGGLARIMQLEDRLKLRQIEAEIEIAPVVLQKPSEIVFKGAGNSHFSYILGQGFQVTTDIPGMGQGTPIKDHKEV